MTESEKRKQSRRRRSRGLSLRYIRELAQRVAEEHPEVGSVSLTTHAAQLIGQMAEDQAAQLVQSSVDLMVSNDKKTVSPRMVLAAAEIKFAPSLPHVKAAMQKFVDSQG